MPDPKRVTILELWGFFLVVVIGIVAGYCVECLDAVQAITEALLPHRHR